MENVKPTLSLNTLEIKVNDKKNLFKDILSTYKYLNDKKNGHEEYYVGQYGGKYAMKYEVKDTTGVQNFYLNENAQVNASSGYIIDSSDTNIATFQIKGDSCIFSDDADGAWMVKIGVHGQTLL